MSSSNMRNIRKRDFERQVFMIAHQVNSIYITRREDENTEEKMSAKWGGGME